MLSRAAAPFFHRVCVTVITSQSRYLNAHVGGDSVVQRNSKRPEPQSALSGPHQENQIVKVAGYKDSLWPSRHPEFRLRRPDRRTEFLASGRTRTEEENSR